MSVTEEMTQQLDRFDFEAEPRVVKSRGKYKINEQQSVSKSQQTFNNLMREKRIRLLDPVSQEQEYVRLEKERIKIENMHSQLNNFKKNKKRMTPYEIKPSANPRIQVNLEFFLTDSANTIEQTSSTVDTQTDAFQVPPPSPPYVPKKTGIDAATQVEDYELFNFDKEVVPILDVIVTKTLEEACLEIEEEQEILSMKKFKDQFVKRKGQEKDKQKTVVQHENDQIAKKNEVLKKYLEREERKRWILKKAQSYAMAGRYLRDLQVNTVVQLVQQGFYPNDFQNQLKTSFLDRLVQRTAQEAIKLYEVKQKLHGTFDSDNLLPIKDARLMNDTVVMKKKIHNMRRRLNQGDENRVVRVVYWDDKQLPTTIVQKFSKFIDGSLEEWEKVYEARMQELDAKLDTEQMTEEEYLQIKRAEFPDTIPNYIGISVNTINKLSFAIGFNPFYQTTEKERKMQPFALVIEKSGKWFVIDQTNQRDGKTLRYKDNYRSRDSKVSDDVAIIVQLEALNIEVCCVVFGFRLPNLQQNSQPQAQTDFLQHSRYSMYDNYNFIPFDPVSVVQTFKFEELVKTFDIPEQNELPQTSIALCYSVTKRYRQFGKWYLESVKTASKGLLEDDIQNFYQRVATYVSDQYESTLLMDKDLVERLIEKEKEGDGGGLSLQDQNSSNINVLYILSVISKRKLPQSKTNLSNLNQTINSKEDSVIHQNPKNLDEPSIKDVPKSMWYSRVINALRLPLNQTFEESEAQLIKHLTNNEAQLIDGCIHGFEIHCRGQPFLRQRQLIKVRTIGQLEVIRKPEPIPEKVENLDQNQDGDPQDNLNNDD